VGFEVYATRWDSPHVVEEVTSARGLAFNLPLSGHGQCSFSATAGPGRCWWRAALSVAMSGILVCSDGVPVWSGMMLPERQSGPRTFDFSAVEWGAFFETCPSVPLTVKGMNDHVLQRRLISDAQSVNGQNIGVILGSTTGAATSDLTINRWDTTTVEEEFRRAGEHEGGPEWYFNTAGTLENPTRVLVQGDHLGSKTPVAVLEHVESTQDYVPPDLPPLVTPLSTLFPGDSRPIVGGQRRGGNVIAHPARQQAAGVTTAIAVGAGDQTQQLRAVAQSASLLRAGYPNRTRTGQYTDVRIPATLQRHANADLAAAAGMTTSYAFATFGTDPDWTAIARGSTVRVELDTDCYATERPLIFSTRVLDIAVKVPDVGPTEVTYVTADVRDS